VNTPLSGDEYGTSSRHCRAQAALVSQALLPALDKAMQNPNRGEIQIGVRRAFREHLAAQATATRPRRPGPRTSILALLVGDPPAAQGDPSTTHAIRTGRRSYGRAPRHERARLLLGSELFPPPGYGSATRAVSVRSASCCDEERPTPERGLHALDREEPTISSRADRVRGHARVAELPAGATCRCALSSAGASAAEGSRRTLTRTTVANHRRPRRRAAAIL